MKFMKKALTIISLMFTLIGILTFAMTYQNIGFSDQFYKQWLSSTVWSVTTIAPLGFLMIVLVSKSVSAVFPKATKSQQNFVIGVSMAVIMESIMALVTTINNVGMKSLFELTAFWGQAFLVALPIGLLMSLVISLVVKPRLERFMAS